MSKRCAKRSPAAEDDDSDFDDESNAIESNKTKRVQKKRRIIVMSKYNKLLKINFREFFF